jgi:amphi-Trp domain-containing protein
VICEFSAYVRSLLTHIGHEKPQYAGALESHGEPSRGDAMLTYVGGACNRTCVVPGYKAHALRSDRVSQEIVLFSSEEHTNRARVSAFLRELADRLEQNAVVLRMGEREQAVDVPHDLVLEVELEKETRGEKVKYSLEVEIEWTEGGDARGPVTLG